MTRPLLLSYYGDDFTGSADVMEALASNGVETVLFLDIPDAALLSRFSHVRAIGIAGTSRSQTPGWMEENLDPALRWLKARNAAICHYKVCSTFDSSPEIGNIGKAVEIGKAIFDQPTVPLVVGAPQLKRYTAFGHLFAAYQGEVYRIDRHPVMSRHPVTPMHEADLRLHLSRQSRLPVGLVDLATLAQTDADARIDAITAAQTGMLLFDVDGAALQAATGRALWRLTPENGWFVAGSSGVEYALLTAWEEAGLTTGRTDFTPPGNAGRIAVVSGSVSPTTERQIRLAGEQGFEAIAVDPLELLGENGAARQEAAVRQGLDVLARGQSPILYTALGPSADRGSDIDRIPGSRHRLGRMLGAMLRRLVVEGSLSRAVIAGGDTSSHALAELQVKALTTRLPLPQTPGSPLCTAHGDVAGTDGLEIALKGGQIGADGYFAQIRDGRAIA